MLVKSPTLSHRTREGQGTRFFVGLKARASPRFHLRSVIECNGPLLRSKSCKFWLLGRKLDFFNTQA